MSERLKPGPQPIMSDVQIRRALKAHRIHQATLPKVMAARMGVNLRTYRATVDRHKYDN